MDSDSLYQDKEVLAVFAELVSPNPFPDCVTGKRGHEHRGSDYRTKRRSGALEWSEKRNGGGSGKEGGGGGGGSGKEGDGGGGKGGKEGDGGRRKLS